MRGFGWFPVQEIFQADLVLAETGQETQVQQLGNSTPHQVLVSTQDREVQVRTCWDLLGRKRLVGCFFVLILHLGIQEFKSQCGWIAKAWSLVQRCIIYPPTACCACAIGCRISGSCTPGITLASTHFMYLVQRNAITPLSKWVRPTEELAMAKLELHQRQMRHVLLKDELQHLQQALLQQCRWP